MRRDVRTVLLDAAGSYDGSYFPGPIPAVDSVFTEELTWMEVRDAGRGE
ncbi:MAG: hypothetical protein ACR2HX_03045 [Pyrinomonadaceae bacterium]